MNGFRIAIGTLCLAVFAVVLMISPTGAGLATNSYPNIPSANPSGIPSADNVTNFLHSQGIDTAPHPLSRAENATVANARTSISDYGAPTYGELWDALVETFGANNANLTKMASPVHLTPEQVFQEMNAQASTNSSAIHSAGQIVPLDNPCDTCILGGFAVVGGSTSVGAAIVACDIIGPETVGLSCIIVLSAIGIISFGAFIISLWNGNAQPLFSGAVFAAGETLIETVEFEYQGIQNLSTTIVALFNETADAWDQEASYAAEYQLQNLTFSEPIDLGFAPDYGPTQYSVASQISAVSSSLMNEFSSMENFLLYRFDTTFGTLDEIGYGCPDYTHGGSGSIYLVGLFTTSGNFCGDHTTGSSNFIYGKIVGGYAYAIDASNPLTVWLASGQEIAVVNGATNFPIIGHNLNTGAWMNFTGSYDNSSVVVTSSGSWYFNQSTNSGSLIYANWGLADNWTEYAPISIGPWFEWRDPMPNNTIKVDTNNGIGFGLDSIGGSNPGYATSSFSGTSVIISHLELYLTTMANNSANVAHAYWSFLHSLGYYSIAAIPPRCVIPPIDISFPTNVPVSDLAKVNSSQILNYYVAYIAGIHADYNLSLDNATFCGSRFPSGGIGGQGIMTAYYGIGYIYLNAYHNNSNGSAPQNFGQPQTWNASGEIWMLPAFGNIQIPVNETWLLPYQNPSFTYVVPFIKNYSGTYSNATLNQENGTVAANGPVLCAVHHICYPDPIKAYFLSNLVGNSTNPNGSEYPLNKTTKTPNEAVYFYGCQFSPQSGNTFTMNLSYVKAQKCDFNTSVINPSGGGCNGTLGGAINSDCGGSAPPIPPSPSGGGSICNTLFIVSTFTQWIGSSALANVPFIGAFASDIGCIIGFIVLGAFIIIIAYVGFRIAGYSLSSSSGGSRGGRGANSSTSGTGNRTNVRVNAQTTVRRSAPRSKR